MKRDVKVLIADQIGAIGLKLAEDEHALSKSQKAVDIARNGRQLVHARTSADERNKLLKQCVKHQEATFRKAAFVVLVEELPLRDIGDSAS